MKTLKKITATIFAILFVITAVMALLLFNFDRRAFSAETYQQAFAREGFYDQLPGIMAKALVSSATDTSEFPIMIQDMSLEAWEQFIRVLLPPDLLKTVGDDVLNSTFGYLNMQSDSVQVNLSPVKTSMAGETGTQAAISLLATLPDCTLDQMAQITFSLLSGGQIEFCNPPPDLLPLLTPVIQGQMQFAASLIPDQLTLVTAPPQNDPRERIQTLRLFMRLSLILPILLLLTLTVFAVRSAKDWLNWWGIPLAITGFSAFVIGVFGAPIFNTVIESILASQLPDYLPTFLLDFTGDFAAAMVRALLTPVVLQGIVLTVIGVGMIVTGRFVKLR